MFPGELLFMAKKKTSQDGHAINGEGGKLDRDGAETTAGYFRKVFKENPRLLGVRSNKPLLARWLKDHPGTTEVPKSVKANLANVKSVLRSTQRKHTANRATDIESVAQQKPVQVARAPSGSTELELLEHQIDECIISARILDREGLGNVVDHLRLARNLVVWKLG
jgi:hypothetical protein